MRNIFCVVVEIVFIFLFVVFIFWLLWVVDSSFGLFLVVCLLSVLIVVILLWQGLNNFSFSPVDYLLFNDFGLPLGPRFFLILAVTFVA